MRGGKSGLSAAAMLGRYLDRASRSQADLAEAVGCSEARISQLIAGNGRPSPELAANISIATFGAVPVAAWYEFALAGAKRRGVR